MSSIPSAHMMSKPRGILVFGANGSGKTKLGRELARVLSFRHMDVEDYAFKESEIPYTSPRTHEECVELMLADIQKFRSFVISAVTGDFGDKIVPLYGLAVFLSAPYALRMERIKQRAHERYGERVREGGDMYEQNQKFIEFAATRSLMPIERWAETLLCPVVRVDGAEDWRINAANIAKWFCELKEERGAKQ